MSALMRDPREVVREEMTMHDAVRGALADGPLTVPQLSERLGRPTQEVVMWVMGMRRFGWLHELPGAVDGYFRYELLARGTDR